jgi:hypothetical protein
MVTPEARRVARRARSTRNSIARARSSMASVARLFLTETVNQDPLPDLYRTQQPCSLVVAL